MIEKLQELGYEVSWSQGPTPEDMREAQRKAGWAWEGDDLSADFPEHRVLKDDTGQPTIWFVEGPTGCEHSDGTPIAPLIGGFVREDDEEAWESLIESHVERQAELEMRSTETPDETAERHQREAEERAAEDD